MNEFSKVIEYSNKQNSVLFCILGLAVLVWDKFRFTDGRGGAGVPVHPFRPASPGTWHLCQAEKLVGMAPSAEPQAAFGFFRGSPGFAQTCPSCPASALGTAVRLVALPPLSPPGPGSSARFFRVLDTCGTLLGALRVSL